MKHLNLTFSTKNKNFTIAIELSPLFPPSLLNKSLKVSLKSQKNEGEKK